MQKLLTDFEIRLPHSTLKDEIGLLGRLVEKHKHSSEMTAYLRVFTLSQTEIQLSATNLESTLHSVATGLASASGKEVLIPIDKFRNIVQTVSGNPEVHIRVSGNTTQVLCGKTKFSLTSPDPAKTQSVFHRPKVESPVLRIGAPELERNLGKISFVIGDSSSPSHLTNCVELKVGATIRLAGTDGIRAVKSEFSPETGQSSPESAPILLHHRSVRHLLELAKFSPQATIEVYESGKHVVFSDGPHTLIESAVVGKFPNIDSVFPQDPQLKAGFNCQHLKEAIKRVGCITDTSECIRLMLEPQEAALAVMQNEAQSAERLAVDYAGQPLSIEFNGKLLLECLNRIEQERVTVELQNNSRVLLIRDSDEKLDFRFVQALMKTNDQSAQAAA